MKSASRPPQLNKIGLSLAAFTVVEYAGGSLLHVSTLCCSGGARTFLQASACMKRARASASGARAQSHASSGGVFVDKADFTKAGCCRGCARGFRRCSLRSMLEPKGPSLSPLPAAEEQLIEIVQGAYYQDCEAFCRHGCERTHSGETLLPAQFARSWILSCAVCATVISSPGR